MLVVTDFGFLLGWHERMHVRLLLQVEVLKIYLTVFYVWFQRRSNRLGLDFLYVDIGEPWVLEYFFYTALRSKPRLLIFI